jgi:diguanylate cyclase (GGDEF)-like protein
MAHDAGDEPVGTGGAAHHDRWAFWGLAARVRLGLLMVELAAVAVVVLGADRGSFTPTTMIWFAVLVVCSTVHVEASRSVERLRELLSDGKPWWNLQGVWSFAALVVLPPLLITAMIALTYLHIWVRVRRVAPHRWIYTAAAVTLASAAGKTVLVLIGHGAPLTTVAGFGGVLAGAVLRWAVNVTLIAVVLIATAPEPLGARAWGRMPDHLVEGASLALGSVIAVLLVLSPLYVPVLLLPVLAVHRSLLLPQFEAAGRVDALTGTLNATFWRELAQREWQRARRAEVPLGLLMVSLDQFGRLVARHGADAGDAAMRAVAATLRREFPGQDAIGRWGEADFVILVPGPTPTQLRDAAERLRTRVQGLRLVLTQPPGAALPAQPNPRIDWRSATVVDGLTVSIGVGRLPEVGADLPELLLAADNALFAAQNAGRDRVSVVRVRPDIPEVRTDP